MKKHYLTYLFLFFLFFCFAQNQKIDSLKQVLTKTGDDTNKVTLLNKLSFNLKLLSRFDEGLKYAEESKALAQKLDFKIGLIRACSGCGVLNFYKGNYNEALKNHNMALSLSQAIDYKPGISAAYNNMGTVYFDLGNFPECLRFQFLSLKIKRELKDTLGSALSLNNIGNAYIRLQNYPQALKYHNAALQIRKEKGDKAGFAQSLGNISVIYNMTGDFEKSLLNSAIALKIDEETGNKHGMALTFSNIGGAYYQKALKEETEGKQQQAREDYELAITNILKAIQMEEELGDKYNIASLNADIGLVYFKMKKYKEAIEHSNASLAIARTSKNLEIIKEVSIGLSNAYSATGDYDKALVAYKEHIKAKDSLFNEENTKKTVRLEMNYDFEKKEAAAKLEQEKKEVIAAAESKKQKIIISAICGILILVFAFAIFVYRSFLQKQKANKEIVKQKEVIEEKQKEILDSIHYAKRIQSALLPSEKYISRNLNKS